MTGSLVAVGIIAAIVLAAVFMRIAAVEHRLRRLSRLDAKLDALLKHAGLKFDPYNDVPRTVRMGE